MNNIMSLLSFLKWMKWKQVISRVLFILLWLESEWAIIYLGLSLPIASSGTNQEPGLWPSSVPRLAPSRGLPSQHLSMLLVRSYRTFAPLPCMSGFPHEAFGGVFLWHYPHGHPHWELPSKPGQIGARTFLNWILQIWLNFNCDCLPCFQLHHASRHN